MTQRTDRLYTALAGRYRIERHLSEGGMASVYLCEDQFAWVPPTGSGHASYDVARDGKSLLMLRPLPGQNEELVVITNWVSEVRAQRKGVTPP